MTSAEGHVNSSLVAKFDQEAIRRAMVKMFTCCVMLRLVGLNIYNVGRQSEDDGKLTIAGIICSFMLISAYNLLITDILRVK
ncbi:unnamed protein product [Trifolium pratense]|uniref:Uncharacterized protein n=1 Tax=Trifolium pratense TaxID=57577 RepID=A0ACB0JTK8_TRIPR|nr:unnamed protein product [Trifolium pratense]